MIVTGEKLVAVQQPTAPAPPTPLYPPTPSSPTHVVITDVEIPFGSMIVLILKFVFASIPAALIVAILSAILMGILAALFGGASSVLR